MLFQLFSQKKAKYVIKILIVTPVVLVLILLHIAEQTVHQLFQTFALKHTNDLVVVVRHGVLVLG